MSVRETPARRTAINDMTRTPTPPHAPGGRGRDQTGRMARHPQTTPDAEADGLKVLIIDDEQFHAEAVAESLERVGYRCAIATSGSAGAKKIEHDDFDVILTDLKMED